MDYFDEKSEEEAEEESQGESLASPGMKSIKSKKTSKQGSVMSKSPKKINDNSSTAMASGAHG